MLSSLREIILNVQNVNIYPFSNRRYETLSEVDDGDFWTVEIQNYGSTLGFQVRKKSSPIRNVLIAGVTIIVLAVILAFVLHGLTRTGKSHLNGLNSALSLANDVTAEDQSRFIQMAQEEQNNNISEDGFSPRHEMIYPMGNDEFLAVNTESNLLVGDDKILDLQLQKNEETVMPTLLTYMQTQVKEEPNNSMMEQIKVLQNRLKELAKQKLILE